MKIASPADASHITAYMLRRIREANFIAEKGPPREVVGWKFQGVPNSRIPLVISVSRCLRTIFPPYKLAEFVSTLAEWACKVPWYSRVLPVLGLNTPQRNLPFLNIGL